MNGYLETTEPGLILWVHETSHSDKNLPIQAMDEPQEGVFEMSNKGDILKIYWASLKQIPGTIPGA